MSKTNGKVDQFYKRLTESSLIKIFVCDPFILSLFPAVFALLLLIISVIENRWDILTTNTYPLTVSSSLCFCKRTRKKYNKSIFFYFISNQDLDFITFVR